MKRAIFLDRDGVLNRNVYYEDTAAWESPREPEVVRLTEGIGPALRSLQAASYLLIIVSNQPNAAKGKCSREQLDQVHARVLALLLDQGVAIDADYLCFHHPDHTGPCACRKPSPFFLLQAAERFCLDLPASWMIGDRASDVACGHAAGVRTVWIDNDEGSALSPKQQYPTLVSAGLTEAVAKLLDLAGKLS